MNRSSLVVAAVLILSTFAFAEDPEKTAEEAAKARVDALDAAMRGDLIGEKTAAISGCGANPHALTADALAPLLSHDNDVLRAAAAAALGLMRGIPEAASALHSGIDPNDEKNEILVSIFTGIASVGQVSSVPVVKVWVEKNLKKKETAKLPTVDAAIECLAGLKFKKTIDQLIALLKVTEGSGPKPVKGAPPAAVDSRIITALSRLTGQGMQLSAEWTTWWKQNQETYEDDLTLKRK